MTMLPKVVHELCADEPLPPITTIFKCLFIMLELKDLLFIMVAASGRLSFLLAIGFP
jgi:hypothetical protein